MGLLLLVVLTLLLFGGGAYYGYRTGYHGAGGHAGLTLFVVLLILVLLFAGR